jgi:hypothetical protein
MPRSPTALLVDADGVVRVTMEQPNMSNDCSRHAAQACCRSTRYHGVCDRPLAGLMLLTLVRTTEVLAGEPAQLAGSTAKPDFNGSRHHAPVSAAMLPIPATYQTVTLPEIKAFPTQEFRPWGHSLLEKDIQVDAVYAAPMMKSTTVWQRLSEYRSHDRVRLVTLWETGGSSVSLQAGRKGDPSLQWTSRLMNRGGVARGVFDELLTRSLGGFGRGLHFTPHETRAESAGKPAMLNDIGQPAATRAVADAHAPRS